MKKSKPGAAFRKGQVVRSGSMVILVTGKGEPLSYPTFAGVVVHSVQDEEGDNIYPVGFHSTTWSRKVFKKTGISMKKLIAKALKATAHAID